ncbi:MAG: helix-turn-helix domain-containing protein [Chitinivibrionales bacterium]|nr:helix-turn-helix domain-containing protein [Chitinivibrionales bacterium]
MASKHLYFLFISLLVIITRIPAQNVSDQPALDTGCIDFISPKAGRIIAGTSCTLSIETCDYVKSLTIKARYASHKPPRKIVTDIGHLTRPPYKLIWQTDSVPNQLVDGLSFYCEALLRNGTKIYSFHEGIFLIHNRFSTDTMEIPFHPAGKTGLLKKGINITGKDNQLISAKTFLSWNKENLNFDIRVVNPAFHSSMSPEKMKKAGVEILIDHTLRRLPYPSSDDYVLTIPLEGKALRTMYMPEINVKDQFTLKKRQEPHTGTYTLKKIDFKGFTVNASIPLHALGTSIPESLGCNLIIKGFDNTDSLITLSWADAQGLDRYAPILWNTLQLKPLPLYHHWAVRLIVPFLLGLGLTFALAWISRSFKSKQNTVTKFEAGEEEKTQLDKIQTVINETITDKNLTPALVASSVELSTSKVKQIVKKYSGMPFHDYIMHLRTEIARERLRSSHSSEAFIANSSGFAGVHEMEKYFQKFHHTTPYKYRKEFHVA